MVPSDRALATFYRISIVTIVSICSGFATIFSGKFQTISSHILEMVRDGAKVAIYH